MVRSIVFSPQVFFSLLEIHKMIELVNRTTQVYRAAKNEISTSYLFEEQRTSEGSERSKLIPNESVCPSPRSFGNIQNNQRSPVHQTNTWLV
jgi:hypothetical protein